MNLLNFRPQKWPRKLEMSNFELSSIKGYGRKLRKTVIQTSIHLIFLRTLTTVFLAQISDLVGMVPDVIIDWTVAGKLPVLTLTALRIMF